MTENQNDIAGELALLQRLTGIEFSHKLEQICKRGEFHPVRNEPDIYTAISEMDDDYNALLAAAKRAVGHGYKVYILPNPKFVSLDETSLPNSRFICPGGGGGLVAKSCLTLVTPWTVSPPGSPVHEILQARILEWVAISFSIICPTVY